jgi:hypothetical protein
LIHWNHLIFPPVYSQLHFSWATQAAEPPQSCPMAGAWQTVFSCSWGRKGWCHSVIFFFYFHSSLSGIVTPTWCKPPHPLDHSCVSTTLQVKGCHPLSHWFYKQAPTPRASSTWSSPNTY